MNNEELNRLESKFRKGKWISIIGIICIFVFAILMVFILNKRESQLIVKSKDLVTSENKLKVTRSNLREIKSTLVKTDSLLTIDLRINSHAINDTNTIQVKDISKYKSILAIKKGVVFVQVKDSIIQNKCYDLKLNLIDSGYSIPPIGFFNKYKFRSEIKYFDIQDKENADKVKQLFYEQFGWNLPVVKLVHSNEEKISRGHLEIWIYSLLPGKFPEASERRLKPSEVSNLDETSKKIMRNEIFARYGFIFHTAEMKSYFNTQPWYKPKYQDVSSRLSKIELQNINLIKQNE